MPLDAQGCTRTTMSWSDCAHPWWQRGWHLAREVRRPLLVLPLAAAILECPSLTLDWETVRPHRDGDRCLPLSALNVECLVSAGHQPALIASLPFVHTARRCYRWC